MERVFWVKCPQCIGEFYANHKEMRHAGVKLLCPFCHHRFLPDEAKSLDEREDTV
jgi:predicted Zn finger-like uncharacterized protein